MSAVVVEGEDSPPGAAALDAKYTQDLDKPSG